MTTIRFTTEKVTQTREVNKGSRIDYATDTFWIAYPPYVSSYADLNARIGLARGKGSTRKAAIAQASA